MKIITGLPHENNDGQTLALFGKPRFEAMSTGKHLMFVDCHIVSEEKKGLSYSHKRISPEINSSTRNKMFSYAKKLAISQLKGGLVIIRSKREYFQNSHWSGFCFSVRNKKPNKS